MPRKCFEPGGFTYEFLGGKCRVLAPNVAAREQAGRFGGEWRDVTWDEVMQRRRERQAERLDRIRGPVAEPSILPCYVWTFFNRQSIPYYGWYCYVVTRQFSVAVNFKGFHETLAVSIMTEIHLGILPMKENFYSWTEEFARRHPRRKLKGDPRKAGALLGWLNDRRTFSLQRPNDL